jgi:mannose-1-phosphate guanylyltransferase/phosphomannomutase
VAELRTIPIPVLRYQLSLQIEAGGVYSRVSPTGGQNMDIVFFDPGGYDIPVAKAKTLERLFLREDFRRASMDQTGKIEFPERVIEYYRDGFLQALNTEELRDSNLKVVIDFGFGGASEILPAILGALDVDVVSVNAYPDPDRVHDYSQDEDKAQKQLSSIVKSLKADAGFLIGPGAEKLVVFDERGNRINNQSLLLKVLTLYIDLVKCKKIAIPVVASASVEAIAQKHKIEVERIPDNHLAMMDAMHKSGVDFVGGTKGGFIFPGFQIGCDAMFAIAKILEIMALSGKHLGGIKRNWPEFHIVRKEVPCSWTKKGLVMRRLMEYTSRKKRILVDGVRFSGTGAKITIKPDRYKASFFVQVESRSKSKAKDILKQYISMVKQWQVPARS